MIYLVHYISGYLLIEFSGEFCEEILNIAAANHITLWKLAYNKGKITGYISIRNFRKLRLIKGKCKTKIKILKKRGLPFKTVLYRGRAGFLAGAAVFILLLSFLSGYIWKVDVCGNKNVKREDIIRICEELGAGIGTKGRKIKSSILSQKLALKIPEIAWASFNVEGSKLTVNVTEMRNLEKDDNFPNNIKAAADGIIEKIDISGGNPVVKVGDTVKSGDLLVSGAYESMNQTVFDRVSGSIIAGTMRTFTAQGNYKQKIYVPSDKEVKHKVLMVFNIKLPLFLGNVTGKYKSETKCSNLKIIGCELPLSVTEKKFVLYEEKDTVYTKEKLKEILEKDIEKQILECGIKEYETKNYSLEENDKGLTVKKTVSAHENIALFENILIDTVD